MRRLILLIGLLYSVLFIACEKIDDNGCGNLNYCFPS